MPHLVTDVRHLGSLGLVVGVRVAAAGVVVVPAHGELHRHGLGAQPVRVRVRPRPIASSPLDERRGGRWGRVAHGRVLGGRGRGAGVAAVRRLALAGARVGRLPRQLRVACGWGWGWVSGCGCGLRTEFETTASIRAEETFAFVAVGDLAAGGKKGMCVSFCR